MIGYENIIYNLVVACAPSLLVFLSLCIILDFIRSMIFSNKWGVL